MSEVIIEFRHVDKHFGGIHAVNDVSFSIEKGEVHTILGENGAGKSTLMNILSGIYTPSSGEIIYKGEAVQISSPLKAKELGIATVFQELKLCPNLTVVQNIFLGREYITNHKPDWRKMNQEAREKLESLGLSIEVSSRILELSSAQRQLVEIAKAMFIDSDVLILDEPTSSLTYEETEKLFRTINILKNRGVSIIFISHRMQEVFEISDRISIMRNGKYIATFKNGEISQSKIVSLISGKDEKLIVTRNHTINDPALKEKNPVALEVRNLNSGNLIKDISFKLYEHEMLGFYGLQGAGRTEIMEAVYGLRKIDSGEIILYDEPLSKQGVESRINKGIAMVSEDRKNVGLFMNFDVMNNICAMHTKDIIKKGPFLSRKKMEIIAEDFKERLGIRADGIHQMVRDLSGGNQQKVSVAKSLSLFPKIMIMDEPTRGVDVGAKAEIFQLLHSLCENKDHPVSIIVVSSELDEIVAECDRIIVIRQGRIAGELNHNEISKEAVLQLSFNG